VRLNKNDIKQWANKVDWPLLLFLVLVLNVKLIIKAACILLFIFIKRKELLRKEYWRQSFIWFYASLILISAVNLLFSVNIIPHNYLVVFLAGTGFWLLCAGASLISSSFTRTSTIEKLNCTLTVFFILNIVITAGQLLYIMWDAGDINPYTYQGMYQKYFISTGDRLTGISFDVSTTNAIIHSLAVIWFLGRHKMLLALVSMIAMLLAASNFINLLLGATLLFLFIFQSTRNQKSIIIICLSFNVLFLSRISPQNNQYAGNKLFGSKKQSSPAAQVRRGKDSTDHHKEILKKEIAKKYLDSVAAAKNAIAEKIETKVAPEIISITTAAKPTLPKADIHSEPYQRRKDTTRLQQQLLAFAEKNISNKLPDTVKPGARSKPGKLIALKQTITYFKNNPAQIITGTGIGNFSSRLAFRATGLQIAGGYPKQYAYTNPAFLSNHLALHLGYFSGDAEKHSLINSPDSVADQLVSEYGIAGILSFILFYFLFFFKIAIRKRAGLPLVFFIGGCLLVGYWFEQLSVMILFELLMLMHKKGLKEAVSDEQ
jgi:hypothetical protein